MKIDSAIRNAINNHKDGVWRLLWKESAMLVICECQPLYFYDDRTKSYVKENGHPPCWNPTAKDLLADDWFSCDMSEIIT